MRLRTLKKVMVANKKVLLRAGFDVPFGKNGKIEDDERIRESLPTIKYLTKNRAKVIIISHNGRPGGRYVKKLAMGEVAKRLSQLLKQKVYKLNDCVGKEVERFIDQIRPGQVVLLENLRFHVEEEKNDILFAKKLAHLGNLYVNDAFSNSHRGHASMVGIPKFLPAYPGFLVAKEVSALSQILQKPKRPFVAIIGGAKISDKLKTIINLFHKTDAILIGGAIANTILKAHGLQVGKSLIEADMVAKVKKLKLTDVRLKIPVDVVVSDKISKNAKAWFRPAGGVRKNEIILDIGEDTLNLYKAIITKARQIVWAGPMGYFEIRKFSRGSFEIAKALAKCKAKTCVGGGDTQSVLEKLGLKNKIDFVSTGGGAMLKFLEGGVLPALKPLIKK
ncbi:MAG: phosphoglycerate kinase [Patescibacteria group bacterium]